MIGLRWNFESLQMVLILFCVRPGAFASLRRGKPAKVQFTISVSGPKPIVMAEVVCDVSRFAVKPPQTLFVKNLDAYQPASLRPCRKPVVVQTGRSVLNVIAYNGSGYN